MNRFRLKINCLFVLFGFLYSSQILLGQEPADSLWEKARSYEQVAQYDNALNAFFDAALAYDREENQIGVVKCYNGVGLLYNVIGDYTSSRKFFDLALQQLERTPDEQMMAYVLNNIGMLSTNINQLDSALVFYQKSLKIKQQLEDTAAISRTFNNIGGVYLEKQDWKKALFHYKQSWQLKQILNDSIGLITIHGNIANVYGWMNQLDSVKFFLDKGMTYRTKDTDPRYLKTYYQNYAEYYRLSENYEKALIYKDSLIQANEYLFNEKMASELSRFQVVYESDKKDQELKNARISNQLLKEQQRGERFKNYLLVLAIIMLVIMAVVIYLVTRIKLNSARQKRELLEKEKHLTEIRAQFAEEQKQRLQKEVEMQSRELIGYSTLAQQKQEMIEELNRKLQGLTENGSVSKAWVTEVKQVLGSGVNMEEEWRKFKIHFEQLHQAFFSRLEKNFPQLTQGDHRHCAYIKIGLTTKEIATLQNISPGSVQKARVRLKKKMNLDPGQDLVAFIQNF